MEIIPNWHPIFVHFTVALLPIAAGFFIMSAAVKGKFQEQWLAVAHWTLWLGVALSVFTVATGIFAYNTVDHDTPSHAAMTLHRNWALATFALYLLVGAWSLIQYRAGRQVHPVFLVLLVIAFFVLASTAWRGGELVYRYGLGVMSLPKSTGEGHDHDHGEGGGHGHGEDRAAAGGGSHDNADGHHDNADGHHDNADGHHGSVDGRHDNADGHHDNIDGQGHSQTGNEHGSDAMNAGSKESAADTGHHHDADSKPHSH